MALNPTNSQQIIVESPESSALSPISQNYAVGSELVGYVVSKVNIWEDVRNRGYQRLWGEYWRLWRGHWVEMDRNRQSERSKVVAPALAQAIDATVAEIEEALFSRDEWFDVASGKVDEIMQLIVRDQLIEDLDKVNVRDQVIEAVLNGALFGTMIAKINVYTGHEARPVRDTTTFELKAKKGQRVWVSVEAIRPDEFIPDPVGKTIEQMHGMAHRMQRPLHYVLERLASGIYDRRALPLLVPTRRLKNSDVDLEDPQSINTVYESEQIDIIEYHGKVPARMLKQLGGETADALDQALRSVGKRPVTAGSATGPNDVTGGEMVEAIVTIANTGILLRAMVNPFVMQDRAFVAAQFEKVPNRFWGRGVAEKGYNPQKALDAEMRARIDAMAYISSPMVAVDAGRLPRGFRYEVKPGKVWTTNGNPQETVWPFPPLNMNTLTFEQTQEMERMVQMGTGAFDTATALRNQSQSGASSLSSNSMMMGAFVKRAKLSIQNIDRNFLTPIIKKVQWRYMQFDPLRYPNQVDLRPKPTLGIVAREVEASQMTQLVGMLPDEYHQAKLVIAKGIVENTSFPNKQDALKVIDGILNPSPQQQQAAAQAQQMQQQMQMLTMAELQGKVRKLQAEVKEIEARAGSEGHDAAIKTEQLRNDQARVVLQQQEQQQFTRQNDIAAARLPIDMVKARAALISANNKGKQPASSTKK